MPDAPGRHGLLALQLRLDRQAEGGGPPPARHPVHVRHLRRAGARASRSATSPSRPPASSTPTGSATTSPFPTGLARRPCCTPAGTRRRRCSTRSRREARRSSSRRRRSTTRSSTSRAPSSATSRSIRHCVAAAEALPAEVWRRWKDAFGLTILDGVGSTEMLHIYCSNRLDDVRPGSSGKPVPGYELKILDDEGNPVASGRGRRPVRERRQRARAVLGPAREVQALDPRRLVLHRRPLPRRRRRLLLVRGPLRRHDQGERPVGLADRDRVRAARASGGGRERGGRHVGRRLHEDQGVRHRQGRRGRGRCARRRAAGALQVAPAALPVPAPDRVRARAAEDGDRQDPALQAAREREATPA